MWRGVSRRTRMRLAFATRRRHEESSLCASRTAAACSTAAGRGKATCYPAPPFEVPTCRDPTIDPPAIDRNGPTLLDADLITQLTFVDSVGSDVNHCSLFATNELK